MLDQTENNCPYTLLDVHGLGKGKVEKELFTSKRDTTKTKKDEFQTSQALQTLTGSIDLNSICKNISSIFSAFKPFTDLVKNLFTSSKTTETKPVTIDDVDAVFDGIDESLVKTGVKMSKVSEKSFDALRAEIETLKQSGVLKNKDLTPLFEQWKGSKDAEILLKIAERLEKGECVDFSDEKLREHFIKSLRAIGRALKEAKEHPDANTIQGKKVINHLECAGDCQVDAAKKQQDIEGKGEKLSTDDKKFIGEKIKKSKEHIEVITNDKDLHKFLSAETLHELVEYLHFCNSFLDCWFKELEKKEEEKRKEEECEERCKKEQEIRVACEKKRQAEIQKQYYKTRLNEKELEVASLKRKFQHDLQVLLSEKNKTFVRHKISDGSKEKSYLQSKTDEAAKKEYNYETQEDRLEASLPPASVCEHDLWHMNDILDFHC